MSLVAIFIIVKGFMNKDLAYRTIIEEQTLIINTTKRNIESTYEHMNFIDSKEYFMHDDEVGIVWDNIVKTIKALHESTKGDEEE